MVKNENQLLGILISNKNINGDCDHAVAVKKSGLDWETYSFLLKNLEEKKYIRFDNEFATLLKFGEINYISPKKQVALWMLKILALTIKELFVFLSGVSVGLAVNYFTHIFGEQSYILQ